MSEALRDHLKRTGVNNALLRQVGVQSMIVENRIGSGNAIDQYMPFGEHFAGYSAAAKNKEAADFVIDSLDHARNTLAKQKRNRQLPTTKALHPVLVDEREMQRLGYSVQPYTNTRNPMEKGAFHAGPLGAPIRMYQGDLRY